MFNPLVQDLVDFHTAGIARLIEKRDEFAYLGPTVLPEFGHFHTFSSQEIATLEFDKLMILLTGQGNLCLQTAAVTEGIHQRTLSGEQARMLNGAILQLKNAMGRAANDEYSIGASGHGNADAAVAREWGRLAEYLDAEAARPSWVLKEIMPL